MQIIINKDEEPSTETARKPYTFAGKTSAAITSNHFNAKNNIDKLFNPKALPARHR
ncbi:hypothetical protein ACJ8MJ_22320 [Serratia sp. CY56907]|uniref:hypothetical protein n=1 Tax=Serratia TaxID=613 RepID=UPI0027E3E1C7|nr:hypothetical protein [Serratia marcescens]MBN5449870.1 hypothetical protein [Serratia marcescens]MDI3229838.1 hypothetical protein [Serratia marcescens]HEN7341903.1 hypothetical protein [Serratia marcescens]HEN7412480.1 hypothetical protein [Serratia marcescens]